MPLKIFKNLPLFLVLLMFSHSVSGKDFAVMNFWKDDYPGASQNWAASKGENGFVFFANHQGLLEFDGVSWHLHTMPGMVTTRAVYAVNDSLIYTSGYQELGYWKRQEQGNLTYHSLNPLVQNLFTKNEEFWNIASQGNAVYFHSFNRIIYYSEGKAAAVNIQGFANTMNSVNGQVLIAVDKQGIYSLERGNAKPFLLDPFMQDKTIRFILPYRQQQLMIGTASDGIFIWDGRSFQEWMPAWSPFFKQKELNRAHLTSSGNLILGTILGGILIFDGNDTFRYRIDTGNGLQNNTVLGITSDEFKNIWLALDRGIDFISFREENGLQTEPIPHIGAVYTAAVFEGRIYLGTNQGLYFTDFPGGENDYRLVPGTQGQIWDCQVIDDHLFVSHNRGAIVVHNRQAHFISEESGGFCIRKDTQSDLLFQSTYSRMVTFRKENRDYVPDHSLDGFNDLIRFLEIDHLGNLWASHMHKGVYRLKLDEKRTKVTDQRYFGANSAFGKDHGIQVFRIENRIVFTTGEKLFTYDDLKENILPYGELNKKLGKWSGSHRIVEAPGHRYWFIHRNGFALFRIFGDEVTLIREYPRSAFLDTPMIEQFENICPLSEDRAILCLGNGIAWLDVNVRRQDKLIGRFSPRLRSTTLINKRNEGLSGKLTDGALQLAYSHNNILLHYSFPLFSADPVFYQYRLTGIQENWSDKVSKPVFRFDRLPTGTYELQVKASDPWNAESGISKLQIEVLSPWYKSLPARAGYLLVFAAVLMLFRRWGASQTLRKEREEREKNERELIRLRNEKLNTEIAHKSKELANSTMSVIKKNEFLTDLKQIIIDQKEQLGSRYPDKYFFHVISKIEKNIGEENDWQVFSVNFEQAHEDFLKKIKDDFPALTAKDLRLCAYLRMNLSSKEIAPLLGITARAVENHRSRLRKKMGLAPDENLIDLILKY